MKDKKIGILTWHYYANFGSALQSYALQTVLEKCGYYVEIINYRNPDFGIENEFENRIRLILSKTLGRMNTCIGQRFAYPYINFQKCFLNETEVMYEKNELRECVCQYHAILCGSDQIWAPNVFNSVYALDFADGGAVKKASYAASIGLNSIPDEKAAQYRQLFSDFSGISVREEAGKNILEKQCGTAATVVLDPTFLLHKEDYKKISRKVREKIDSPYVFCYFLNGKHTYKDAVLKFTEDKLPVVGFSAKKDDGEWMNVMNDLGPCEFLWLIRNASYVLTDSYHGTIFSLLFQKEFYTFERFSNNDYICQNSRIEQLIKYFSIKDRFVAQGELIRDATPVNYTLFEETLKQLRAKSMSFLSEAVK